MEQAGKNLKKDAETLYNLKTIGFDDWVFINSFWDDLVRSVEQKDSLWIADNLKNTMPKFDAEYLWLMNNKGEMICSIGGDSMKVKNQDPLFKDQMNVLLDLQRNPFQTYYINYKDTVVKISTAPIQPSDDEKRTKPHRGYFIAGQKIGSKFLGSLVELTNDTKFSLSTAQDSSNFKNDTKNSIVKFSMPLLGRDKELISTLFVSQKQAVLQTYNSDLGNYLLAFIGIIVATALAMFYFVRRSIITPLGSLSKSLEQKNGAVLDKLQHSKTEMGQLASLVSNFFKQNNILQEEIHTRKESEAALLKSAEKLQIATVEKIRAEQSHLAKSEFLSTMSHEIRTPINGVIGVCNILMDEDLTKKQKELVDILNFSSKHLLSLVSDILDLSKIESGNMKISKSVFDVKQACEGIVELYQSKAKEKNITVAFKPEVSFDYLVNGDKTKLFQIISNLVSNAIKFTEEGSVVLSYHIKTETEHKVQLQFRITDTGIGISRPKIQKIFESFAQANSSIPNKYGGTGLGLTISKKLLELQGSDIVVESEEGKGSVFLFDLNFEKVQATKIPASAQNKIPAKSLKELRVLIAEDFLINSTILGIILEKWDVNYVVAENGQEALDHLSKSTFDVILMDLQMPVLNGKQATKLIRADLSTSYYDIPIVAITADATSTTRDSLADIGFDDYITKPFDSDLLFDILYKYHKLNEN